MLWSVWSCSGTLDLMYLLVGNYDKNTYQSVQAESKRFYGENGLFFRNTEYSFSHRLMVSETLIYRIFLINRFINQKQQENNMNKFFNLLAIIANVAIVTGLVKDTYKRLTPDKRRVTTPDYDEV